MNTESSTLLTALIPALFGVAAFVLRGPIADAAIRLYKVDERRRPLLVSAAWFPLVAGLTLALILILR